MYKQMIAKATGISDDAMLRRIEDCMRQDIFHSTLDWQTSRQFNKGARDALAMLQYADSDEGKAYIASLQT